MITRWAVLGILAASLAGLTAPLQAANGHSSATGTVIEGQLLLTSPDGTSRDSAGHDLFLTQVDPATGHELAWYSTTASVGGTFSFGPVPAEAFYHVVVASEAPASASPCETSVVFWAMPETIASMTLHCIW